MSAAASPEGRLAHMHSEINNVFLITGSSCDESLAEDLRNEIRNSGWECEIVQADASDRDRIRMQVHEMLDRFDQNPFANHAGSGGERLIHKMTAEEWLAQ